jgi:hypothetical protein
VVVEEDLTIVDVQLVEEVGCHDAERAGPSAVHGHLWRGLGHSATG